MTSVADQLELEQHCFHCSTVACRAFLMLIGCSIIETNLELNSLDKQNMSHSTSPRDLKKLTPSLLTSSALHIICPFCSSISCGTHFCEASFCGRV